MYKDAKEWERYLGGQLKSARVRKELTQEEVASRSGISTVTMSRLESGKGSSLETLIKVLIVLDEVQWIEQLEPEVNFSPIQQLQLQKQRERVRKKK